VSENLDMFFLQRLFLSWIMIMRVQKLGLILLRAPSCPIRSTESEACSCLRARQILKHVRCLISLDFILSRHIWGLVDAHLRRRIDTRELIGYAKSFQILRFCRKFGIFDSQESSSFGPDVLTAQVRIQKAQKMGTQLGSSFRSFWMASGSCGRCKMQTLDPQIPRLNPLHQAHVGGWISPNALHLAGILSSAVISTDYWEFELSASCNRSCSLFLHSSCYA